MTATYRISHIGGSRGADELVVYRPGDCDGTTKTNQYGWEACVRGDRVVSCGQNDSKVPDDGFVLSGHGKAAEFLASNLFVGCRADVDGGAMLLTVERDRKAEELRADALIAEIRERLDERVAEGRPFDRKAAEERLASALAAKADGDFERVRAETEEAYYLTAQSVPGEIRAVWHRPKEQSEAEVERTVTRFRDAGFGVLLIEVNYEGFANAQKCVHDFLPIRPAYADGFDVVDAFIRVGHRHGMEIHAWFEDFFFGVADVGCPMAELHPEWMARRRDGGLLHDAYDTFYFLNPALPEVRSLLLGLCRELLDNYDFDGLQLDYIRYPVGRGLDRSAGFEEQTKALFLQDTGIRLDDISDENSPEWETFTRWRADKVTDFVRSVHALVQDYRAIGRKILLSTAVFGDPVEAIRLKCQDWRFWVRQRWLDAIYPMAYLNSAEDVGREVAYMVREYGEAPNISGISPMYNGLPVIESTRQVEACRAAGAAGVAFFATHNCTDEQLEKLKIGVFRE